MSDAALSHPPIWKHGHFSREELDGARHYYEAAVQAVRAGTVINPEIATLIHRVQVDVIEGALALSGGNPEMPHQSDNTITTRQMQLDRAWFHRTRAIDGTIPDALRALEKEPRNIQRKQATDFLENAAHYLYGIDTTLAYAQPAPQPLLNIPVTGADGEPIFQMQTELAVVGPHGFFLRAISESFWALHYAQQFIGAIIKLAEDRSYERAHLKEIMAQALVCQLWQLDCAAKVAGIPEDVKNSRFCSVLYILDTWLDAFDSPKPGLPFIMKGIMRHLTAMLYQGKNPAMVEALDAYAEWWAHMNDAADACLDENASLRKLCHDEGAKGGSAP